MGAYSQAVLTDTPAHYWRVFENFGALALEDLAVPSSYLFATGVAATGGASGISTIPGCGWSGVASDGGSFCVSGTGFHNFVNTSGTQHDPPGVALSVPGALEYWFFGGTQDAFTQVYWYFPALAAGVREVGIQFGPFRVLGKFLNQTQLVQTGLSPNAWHHGVLVWTTTTMNLYLDGSSVQTTAVTLSASVNPDNFYVGTIPTSDEDLQGNGFIAEIATYNYALGAGAIANHFAAADSRTNQPVFYGIRPATVTSPNSYALGPTHTGLTGTGSISLAGGTVAALISVTTDTPEHGEIIGNPDYLLSRGYVNASNALGTVYAFDRLVFGTQVRELPRFTSLISWSFPPNLVVSITELFVR